ncbi:hypothetical protein HanPI659440_Chr13g0515691 [Helianthus annuus]|nr:hypothetical protein HanPI659440_Chr13g0515691 [Helianthus annuus]
MFSNDIMISLYISTKLGFTVTSAAVTASSSILQNAEANSRDQGLPSYRKKEGCTIREDQKDQGYCQVQGSLLKVPVHPMRS